ncbi:MAG: CoA transferase subunit A [Armatimonadetes bacterium]|nr:CoA transferase subunit A [Armatimonadota bacterium]
MNKVGTMEQALSRVHDGATIMMGGFGLCGIPEHAVKGLLARGTRNLTIISNNAGVEDAGIGLLVRNGQVRKMISTYIGENKVLEARVINGEIDVELNPQGTFAERIRAGGAGLGGFFTPTGVGTVIAEGKETRLINGREYVLEMPLRAEVAFVKAWKADPMGNLIYRKTARNFNPVMATAAEFTVAEVEELVAVGALEPDAVVTPGVYVDLVVVGEQYEKRIEKRVYRATSGAGA